MPYIAPIGYLGPCLIIAAGFQLAVFSGQPLGYSVPPLVLLSGLITYAAANVTMTLKTGPSIPGFLLFAANAQAILMMLCRMGFGIQSVCAINNSFPTLLRPTMQTFACAMLVVRTGGAHFAVAFLIACLLVLWATLCTPSLSPNVNFGICSPIRSHQFVPMTAGNLMFVLAGIAMMMVYVPAAKKEK